MSIESNLFYHHILGVEEAFFTLARYARLAIHPSNTLLISRDIKKRLIDTAGKDDPKNANVSITQKTNGASSSCCS